MKRIVLAVLLASLPSFAQVVAIDAVLAADKAVAELHSLIVDIKNEKMLSDRMVLVRKRATAVQTSFVETAAKIKTERERLEVDKKANGPALERLTKAEALINQARDRLVTLNKNMETDVMAANALRSGFLARTATEVKDSVDQAQSAIDSSRSNLASDVGFVELKSVKLTSGKVRLFVLNGGSEEELLVNKRVAVAALPVTIRAEVNDEQRRRLGEQKEKGSLPAGTSFVTPKAKCATGRAFAYSNPKVGQTDWTAKEEHTWQLRFDSKDFLSGFQTRSSDACATNDVVELNPKSGATQRLVLGLSSKSTWQRSSTLGGKVREETVMPADGQLEAQFEIATWPK